MISVASPDLKSTYCKSPLREVVVRHPVLLAASIDADDVSAFRSYRSREPNGAVCIGGANFQNSPGTRTAREYAYEFRCLRLEIQQFTRVFGLFRIVSPRMFFKLSQKLRISAFI